MEESGIKAMGSLGLFVLSIIAGAALILIWIYFLIKKKPAKVLPSTSWQEYSSFQKNIKSSGSEPEKIISYGKTYFKYDEAGRKIFVQTAKIPQGMRISSDDVVSAEIFRDGKVIETEAANTQPDFSGRQHIETSCFDLHITVVQKDGLEIILPVIDSPTQYEYIYTRALEVANEITAILKEIINKRNK